MMLMDTEELDFNRMAPSFPRLAFTKVGEYLNLAVRTGVIAAMASTVSACSIFGMWQLLGPCVNVSIKVAS